MRDAVEVDAVMLRDGTLHSIGDVLSLVRGGGGTGDDEDDQAMTT